MAVAHGRNGPPAGALANRFFAHFSAAPRGDDDIRPGRDDRLRIHHAAGGVLLAAEVGENRLAAGDLDQLLHPADAADERVHPFLEEHARAAWKAARRFLHAAGTSPEPCAKGKTLFLRPADPGEKG